MSLKDRISAFENDAKIPERIASQYDETSTEHAALKHAAIALWYVLTDNYEAFMDYVTKFESDLTPEQRSHLTGSSCFAPRPCHPGREPTTGHLAIPRDIDVERGGVQTRDAATSGQVRCHVRGTRVRRDEGQHRSGLWGFAFLGPLRCSLRRVQSPGVTVQASCTSSRDSVPSHA